MRGEKGYTIIEIAVSLILLSLVMGFIYSVYSLGMNYFIKWKEDIRFYNKAQMIMTALREDIYKAEQLHKIEGNLITLEMKNGSQRTYSLKGEKIQRDNRALHGGELQVTVLAFKTGGILTSEGLFVRGRDKKERGTNQLTKITYTLQLTNERDTLTLKQSIKLRKPVGWKTIKKGDSVDGDKQLPGNKFEF